MKTEFRSPLERRTSVWLTGKGIAHEYEGKQLTFQTRQRMTVCARCGHNICYQVRKYTPDFVFAHEDWVLEVKGRLTSQNRTKYLGVKAAGYELRFLFNRDNTLTKANRMRYSKWCEAHGFKYCIQTLPLRWFTNSRRHKRYE